MPAQLLKGALARVNRRGEISDCFVFSLNPEQLNRRIHWPEEGTARRQTVPSEQLSFKLVLDAADILEKSQDNRYVAEFGIRPQLAALQALIQSTAPSTRPKTSSRSYASGTSARILTFMWGREPLIPVRMVSLNVREELFDSALNPLRASVWVELEALSPRSKQTEFITNLSEVSIKRMRQMAALAWAPAVVHEKTDHSHS